MTDTVRVLLVDDDALVRAGLAMMLGAFDGIEVAGAVADGAEVPAAVHTHRPHVVLMDIRMPGIDGLTATESLRARRDAPEVIVLTTFDTDAHVLRAMRAGASGFLLKHTGRPARARRPLTPVSGSPAPSG
jgi:DNA-binding NarL/FixJ family response regulator